jgi:hypothetical protein
VEVDAYDNNNNQVFSKVSVDGYYYWGSTSGGVRSPPGTHMIAVENNPDGWHGFNHFDGYGYGQNPIEVDVNSVPTNVARYDVTGPPHYWLTVDAYWPSYGWALNPNVYVDGQWVGTAPVSVYLEEGYHYVEVDDIWMYWRFVEFSGGLGNPAYIPVYSETGITAYYDFQ